MKHRQLSPEGASSGTGFENLSDLDFMEVEGDSKGNADDANKGENGDKGEGDKGADDAQKAAQEAEAKLKAAEEKEKADKTAADAEAARQAAAKKTPEELAKEEEEKVAKMSDKEKADYLANKEKQDALNDFKIPGEEDSKNDDAGEEESNWINVSKKLGFEIKEDSFEEFEKNYKEKLIAVEKAAEKRIADQKFEEHIASLPIENQATIIGLRNGLKLEEVIAPFKQIETLKAMDDADLVAADLKGDGYEDDYIELKIQKLTENDELSLRAKEIRKFLTDNEAKMKEDHLNSLKQLEAKNTEKIAKAKENDLSQLKESVNKINEFLDTPVSDKIRNYIVKNYESGKYHDAFKDPEKVARFLLWDEFGEQGIKNMKQKAYERGRDEKANKLHNIPPVIKSAGSKQSTGNAVDATGNFGALDHLLEE